MQNNGNSEQPVLIIAGMHRSGTSLTAALLQSVGVDVGQRLLGKSPSNLKGHFENLDFLEFHQAVLHSVGISEAGWTLKSNIDVPEYYVDLAKQLIQKNASSTQPWAWKDPRTVLFLNFWVSLIPEAKFVFIYRSPWEVIDSLYRRGDKFDEIFNHNPQFALDLWLSYNRVVLDFYNQFPNKCVLTHLSKVTNAPAAFITAVNQRLSLALDEPTEGIYDSSLLNKSVHSQRALLIQRYFPEAYTLYQKLNCVAEFSDAFALENHELVSPTAWLLKDWLDVRGLEKRLGKEVSLLQEQLAFSKAELANADQERQQLQVEHQQLQVEHQQLQVEHQQLQTEHQQLQVEHQQLQTEHQQLQADFSKLMEDNNQFKDQLQFQLEHQQAEIAAMKTSKFWQLRSQWFKLKALLHIKE